MLGPLQDNGGPTRTMAPLPGSPLIDGGPPTCTGLSDEPLTADQRGRPAGAPCDIGAYEAIAPGNATPAASAAAATGQTLTCAAGTSQRRQPADGRHHLAARRPAGRDGAEYTIPGGDAGHALGCRQTATNAYGSATADSAAVADDRGAPRAHAARLGRS